MAVPRRQFLGLAAGAATLPGLSHIARARTYPSRPVRLIVGYPPGGGTDAVARLIGQWLSERFAQPFVIENRPGAASNIGTEAVVRSSPDGYTLLLVNTAAAISATFYSKLNFNFIRDIAPVGSIGRSPFVMVVHLSVPASNLPEFIAHARKNPGKINMASSGNGTLQHVAGELFKMMAGVDMVHIPYRGGAPAMTDLLSGHVHVMFNPMSESIESVRAGKIRAIAVTTATRAQVLPDIPTIGEFVHGYEASGWNGIGAPMGTPAEVIHKLNNEINAGLADPKFKARLADMGATVLAGPPADFGKLIAGETEKWDKVIRAANIRM